VAVPAALDGVSASTTQRSDSLTFLRELGSRCLRPSTDGEWVPIRIKLYHTRQYLRITRGSRATHLGLVFRSESSTTPVGFTVGYSSSANVRLEDPRSLTSRSVAPELRYR
jgi:hypothetical protein